MRLGLGPGSGSDLAGAAHHIRGGRAGQLAAHLGSARRLVGVRVGAEVRVRVRFRVSVRSRLGPGWGWS